MSPETRTFWSNKVHCRAVSSSQSSWRITHSFRSMFCCLRGGESANNNFCQNLDRQTVVSLTGLSAFWSMCSFPPECQVTTYHSLKAVRARTRRLSHPEVASSVDWKPWVFGDVSLQCLLHPCSQVINVPPSCLAKLGKWKSVNPFPPRKKVQDCVPTAQRQR